MSVAHIIYKDNVDKSDYILTIKHDNKRDTVMLYMPEHKAYYTTTYVAKHFMTVQEWYDKYILEIADASQRPKCYCGKDMVFYAVREGYRPHNKCFFRSEDGFKVRSATVKKSHAKLEVKQRISSGLKHYHETHVVPEALRRLRANSIHMLYENNPEQHKIMSNAQRRSYANNPERRQKLSAAIKKAKADKGCSAHTRRLLSEARIRHWLSLSEIERIEYSQRFIKSTRGKLIKLTAGVDIHKCIMHPCITSITVRSKYEYAFVQLLEQLDCAYEYERHHIEYVKPDTHAKAIYIPDFYVYYNDYVFIIEVKPWCFHNDAVVHAKYDATVQYCRLHHKHIALIVYEGEIFGTVAQLQQLFDSKIAKYQ